MIELSLLSVGNDGWGDELLSGFCITLQLALTTLPIGLLIGFGFALCQLSTRNGLRRMGYFYTTVLRGLPELLTLFLVYNGVAMMLTAVGRWISPDAPFVQLSPFIAGVIALSLVFGAFAAEVLRGAFQAIPKGQKEAGLAIGMSHFQVFYRIELPQLWRYALPGLSNLWVNLLKDTALVSVIALDDLMRMTSVAVGATRQPFTFFLIACAAYWLVCLLSEMLAQKLEHRINKPYSTRSV